MWRLPLPLSLPFSIYCLLFLFFPTWTGPDCGARVERTPWSEPPYSFVRGAAAAWTERAPPPFFFFFFNTPLSLIDS